MKRRTWIAALMITSIGLCLLTIYLTASRRSTTTVTWGGPVFTVSEWDYFIDQMAALREVWHLQDIATPSRENATENEKILAVDLDHRMLWIETPGISVPTHFVELPAAMDWSLYYSDANDLIELPSFLCFTSPQDWGWDIALVGQRQSGYKIAFVFSKHLTNEIIGHTHLDLNVLLMSPFRRYKGSFSAFIIFDSERLDRIAQHRPSKTVFQDTDAFVDHSLDPDVLNKIAWQTLQKTLYRTLEQKALDAGYEVERITTQPGPDYSAGMAGLRLKESQPNVVMQQLYRFIRRPWLPARRNILLTIEADPDGRWHCQNDKRSTGMRRPGLTLDFYIDPPSGIPLADISNRQTPHLGNSNWSLTLSDGTSIEIVGVYARNSKDWWGPDGRPLDHWPGFFSGHTEDYRILMRKLASTSVQYAKSLSEFRGWLNPSAKNPEQADNQCTLILRVPSSNARGRSDLDPLRGKDTALYGNSSPLTNRFGLLVLPGQYITLRFDQQQNVISYCIGVHLLRNRDILPAIISENHTFLGTTNDPTPWSRRMSDTYMKNLTMEWIRLENLSLQPGNITDFQMRLTDGPCNAPNRSKFAVQPRSMRQSP